jgi:hypothetical protein
MKKQLVAALAGALLVGLTAATPAYASHTYVSGNVRVQHGANTVATPGSGLVSCTSTSGCSVNVTPSKRDYNRVVRWCNGQTTFNVTIPAGQFGWSTSCLGPSNWAVVIDVNLYYATHSSDVTVTVNVIG